MNEMGAGESARTNKYNIFKSMKKSPAVPVAGADGPGRAFSRLGRRHVVMIEAVKHREAAMPAV